MIIETERLVARRFENTDLVPFYDMVRDPEVMKYINSLEL